MSKTTTLSYFSVKATGNTFPAKDHFHTWGWMHRHKEKAWYSPCVSTGEMQYLMHEIAVGQWPGITLCCLGHKDHEPWEDQI